MKEIDDEKLGDIDYPEFHKHLTDTIYIVRKVMETKRSYKETYDKLYTYMKQGFEKPEVRKHPLKFKFTSSPKEPVREMEVRHFLINMILWSAFTRFDKVDELNSTEIFDATNPTKKNLYGYINDHIITPYIDTIDSKTINKALTSIIYKFNMIYCDFALIMGLTMDMESFDELRSDPEFDDLLHTKPVPGMQPKQIEDMLSEKLELYLDIVKNRYPKNNIRPFLIAGAGINTQQLSQLSIMGGLKPDIEGNVNPTPIDSNYIYGGLNSISNFYIDGQSGCKPMILNKTIMGRSGYFSYKAMTLSSTYRLSQTTDDCHSARPIKYEVKTKKHLTKIEQRFRIDPITGKRIKISKDDTDLIGQTILLRDPITCTCADGICRTCYGDMYFINNDPNFHAGRFAATQLCNPIGQNILSSKHMLRTNSDLIEFIEEFDRFFILDTNKIQLNMDSKEDFKKWSIRIEVDDVNINDPIIGPENFNYSLEKFTVFNKKTDESYTFVEKCKRDLYLFSGFAKLIHNKKPADGYHVIPFSKLSNEPFAVINIANNELTAPLKNITKLMDKKDHYGCETIDELVNTLVDLTIVSGINVMAVHGSMLLKGLVRDKDNILQNADFTKPEAEDNYQILTLTKALHDHASLTTSFAFDNINKQLVSPITYKKYGKSDYDIFFKEDIHEDAKKYYRNKKKNKNRIPLVTK